MIVNTLKNICRYVSLNISLEKKNRFAWLSWCQSICEKNAVTLNNCDVIPGIPELLYPAGFISIFSRNATYSSGVRISGNSRCWCYYLIGHVYRKINELSNEDLRKSGLGFRHRILSFFSQESVRVGVHLRALLSSSVQMYICGHFSFYSFLACWPF